MRPDLSFLAPSWDSWLGRTIAPPPEEPQVVNSRRGPLVCSSNTALQPYPTVIWDANGYYRALGVDPKATKGELRRAYQRLGGQRSAYLTFVLKQLLDPAVRRAYDATRLGRPYVDEYVSDALKTMASRESGQRFSEGVPDTRDEVLAEWGISVGDNTNDSTSKLDDSLRRRQDQGPPESQWTYAYYVWATWSDDDTWLPEWQRMVVSALAGRGVTARLAVGLRGGSTRPFVSRQGDYLVVYLGEGQVPTDEMADSAARLITELHAS